VIRTRTRLVRADGTDWAWRLSLKVCGGRDSLTARLLVNASGPWVAGGGAERALRRPLPAPVPLLNAATLSSDGDSATTAPICSGAKIAAPALPRARFHPHRHDPRGVSGRVVAPSADGIAALCAATRAFLRDPVAAGLLSGRLRRSRTTLGQAEPGPTPPPCRAVDFAWDGIEALVARTQARWPFLDEPHAHRLVSAYGTRVERILNGARRLEDLGPCFGADLAATEIRYLKRDECAQTAEDGRWRRSKLGLRLHGEQQAAVAALWPWTATPSRTDRRMATIVVTRFTRRQLRHGPMPRQSLRAA
jgi:glycerol-3-phosphate dehydrogenase